VSLAQIEYFVAVAEEGHVGRAAQKLHVAQPAVSRQIRRLEDELRAPLFMRTPRGMRLSEAGAIFLRHAREILAGIEAARGAIQRASHRAPVGVIFPVGRPGKVYGARDGEAEGGS
jgi:DNA-binding transcriptional LysR family regulator